jgi:hypothetical protein
MSDRDIKQGFQKAIDIADEIAGGPHYDPQDIAILRAVYYAGRKDADAEWSRLHGDWCDSVYLDACNPERAPEARPTGVDIDDQPDGWEPPQGRCEYCGCLLREHRDFIARVFGDKEYCVLKSADELLYERTGGTDGG